MTRWLDYAFAVTGDSLDREYPYRLHEALRTAAPWLDEEPMAAIHPLRGLTPSAGELLIGGRTRVVLRIPETRLEACRQLQETTLDISPPLRLGSGSGRELLPHPVLHAKLVVTGAEDEATFVTDVRRAATELELDCELIVGRCGELLLGAQRLAGFSLMLHGLSAAESLRAQAAGIGLHRKLGCGVFVPHKSVVAVGL